MQFYNTLRAYFVGIRSSTDSDSNKIIALHPHRHSHIFGLVLILAFVQILVLIRIFGFLVLAVKIGRNGGAFLFLVMLPDLGGNLAQIA